MIKKYLDQISFFIFEFFSATNVLWLNTYHSIKQDKKIFIDSILMKKFNNFQNMNLKYVQIYFTVGMFKKV